MEVLFALFGLGLVLAFPVLAIAALVRASHVARDLDALRAHLLALDARVGALGKRVVADRGEVRAAVPPAEARGASPQAASVSAPAPVPEPTAPAPSSPAQPAPEMAPRPTPHLPPHRPSQPAGPAAPTSRPGDLATNLGPKILVAVGALAMVTALGFFVKYAWENNWIGPTGRVLFGCAVSLALLAGGLRLLGHVYRPLGQGLSGAGLAGLYTSLYGAHAFYGLISRGAAGGLLLLVTASAILLSARLDARLLAALAWIGGYLTPVLLSTGEDKALSLFTYLFLLGAGALVLDRSKPWPETAPLAMMGTLFLYGGWYAQFFRPERFDTAAFGIVLFTALFALGMARKERAVALAVVFLVASVGLAALGAQADRPEALLVMSLSLAAATLYSASRLGWGLSVVAGVALSLPYLAWCGAHSKEVSFGLGAGWLVCATLLYVAAAASKHVPIPVPLEGTALVVSALFTLATADVAHRPGPLLVLLLAQCGIAVLSQRRWVGAEPTGVATAAIVVLASYDRLFQPEHSGAFLQLTFGVFGAYLLVLIVRGLLARTPIGSAGAAVHLIDAAFVWAILYRVLYSTSPSTLGLASVGLAALYLVLGLALLRAGDDPLHARVALGLAASFVTLAIPVQLGLNGITLAWAAEGLVLLSLGVRFGSRFTRLGGYAVLALAVVRLFARHAPLHTGEFQPVLNPAFATWLAVIASLGLALYLTREVRVVATEPDRWIGTAISTVLLVLLFGVLTDETRNAFAQRERVAARGQDEAAVEQARLMGGLAVSVLWSAFATALLATGLAVRNRPLFYTAYVLFAVTAGKVVLVDLAELQTLYRILSFLILGVLLMAGAFLSIRFRERLLPREGKA